MWCKKSSGVTKDVGGIVVAFQILSDHLNILEVGGSVSEVGNRAGLRLDGNVGKCWVILSDHRGGAGVEKGLRRIGRAVSLT
jgi:hypothetical protein